MATATATVTEKGNRQQAIGNWQRLNGKRQTEKREKSGDDKNGQKHLLAQACAMGDGLAGGSRWPCLN